MPSGTGVGRPTIPRIVAAPIGVTFSRTDATIRKIEEWILREFASNMVLKLTKRPM